MGRLRPSAAMLCVSGLLLGLPALLGGAPDPGLLLSYSPINDRGQVAFVVTLTDGRGVLLRATPARAAAD